MHLSSLFTTQHLGRVYSELVTEHHPQDIQKSLLVADKRSSQCSSINLPQYPSAIILTNSDEIKELELTKLFKDQVTVENEKKKGTKKKQKTQSSEESLNNIQHTTDDSGI
ncbi:unnamed protein product [Pieris brassicae]|uniref:Uncharacterized protein n=1 Tax=Pieris brassicae TaxID=7116 RepID=A0A9P0TJY8_PIEBR|nr:unnamed protein product [Pieris brassicae]